MSANQSNDPQAQPSLCKGSAPTSLISPGVELAWEHHVGHQAFSSPDDIANDSQSPVDKNTTVNKTREGGSKL